MTSKGDAYSPLPIRLQYFAERDADLFTILFVCFISGNVQDHSRSYKQGKQQACCLCAIYSEHKVVVKRQNAIK